VYRVAGVAEAVDVVAEHKAPQAEAEVPRRLLQQLRPIPAGFTALAAACDFRDA
jgi:hypothetical protein